MSFTATAMLKMKARYRIGAVQNVAKSPSLSLLHASQLVLKCGNTESTESPPRHWTLVVVMYGHG